MNRRRYRKILFFALCVVSLLAGPAWAQQDSRWYPESATNSSTQASLEVRFSQLEMEIRTLTGRLEQQDFEIRQINETAGRTIADLERRIRDLEVRLNGGTAASAGQSSPSVRTRMATGVSGLNTKYMPLYTPSYTPSVSSARTVDNEIRISPLSDGDMQMVSRNNIIPSTGQLLGTLVQRRDENGEEYDAETPVHDNPTSAYEYAFTLLRGKNYDEAEQAFRSFLDRYDSHILATNAKYWLGETFYVRGDYERAARVFAEAYQEHPKSAKGPDNLLKLGMSLAGMGKTEDSCLAFIQLKREYARGSKPVLGRAQQEMDKLGCE